MTPQDEGQEAAVRVLTQYRDALLAKLRAVEQSIELLQGHGIRLSPGEDLIAGGDASYKGLKAQDAAEQFLRSNPDGQFKASEIANALKTRGFETKARAVASVVTSSLNRLVHKQIAVKQKRNNVFHYSLRKENEAEQKAALLPVGQQGP